MSEIISTFANKNLTHGFHETYNLNLIMLKRNSYIFKLAYLSGLMKNMGNGIIGIRSRNKHKRIILLCLSPFFILYGFILKIYARIRVAWKEHGSDYKYRFSVVVIAKNEGDYIEEWVAYYKVIGADCIFLYDNESSDGLKDKLQKYIEEGFVIYNYIEGLGKQYEAYNDAIKRYGSLCKYMAFVDCDEFLMPSDPSDNVIDIIEHVFKRDKSVGALGINWYMFGSSGQTKKTDGLVMERFVERAVFDSVRNKIVKSIVNPRCVKEINHPHYPVLYKGYYTVGIDGALACGPYHEIYQEVALRVNHYYTKSREEWDKRRSLNEVMDGSPKKHIPFETVDDNDVRDETALYYVNQVKAVMTQYRNIE